MSERIEIIFGDPLEAVLEDDNGLISLSGATVVLQRRVDCGAITEIAATIESAAGGAVSVSNLDVGHYQIRWQLTPLVGSPRYFPRDGWDELIVKSVDACNTFDLFVDNVLATVFPEDSAENLSRNHRNYTVDALIDLQQKIPGLRVRHKDRTYQADTYFECGATVVSAPRGFISRVYSVLATNCCDVVEYDAVDNEYMDCLLREHETCGTVFEPYPFYEYTPGNYVPYPEYGCLYYGDSSGNTDRARSCHGWVTIKNGLLYVYPHLNSDEILVVEWDGVKRSWKDTDEVSWDREISDVVEHYLEAKTARREDCDLNKAVAAQQGYEMLVHKLIWQDRKENRIKRRRHCFNNCNGQLKIRRSSAAFPASPVIPSLEAIVSSYDELRTLVNPATYQIVKVLGYASAYDGGGGIFIRQQQTSPATTDDDSIIIVSAINPLFIWQKWL